MAPFSLQPQGYIAWLGTAGCKLFPTIHLVHCIGYTDPHVGHPSRMAYPQWVHCIGNRGWFGDTLSLMDACTSHNLNPPPLKYPHTTSNFTFLFFPLRKYRPILRAMLNFEPGVWKAWDEKMLKLTRIAKACSFTREEDKDATDEEEGGIPCSAIICARPWEEESKRMSENTQFQYTLVLWWSMLFQRRKTWHQDTLSSHQASWWTGGFW